MNGLTAYALSKKYTEDSLMGAGALKGERGEDGLFVKALSITQDDAGKIIDATATLSDNSIIKVDIITSVTPSEERLEGDGAEYYTLAPTPLSFRSDAPLNELQDVQINGVTVDPSNYTIEEGSTIVTFSIDYLKTLNIGDYKVAVISESKSVEGNFTVTAPELDLMGFYYGQPYTGYVPNYGTVSLIFNKDNTASIYSWFYNVGENVEYTCSNNCIYANSEMFGESEVSVLSERELLSNGLSFVLNESYVADTDYIYWYNEEIDGYEVTPINKTKTSYAPIRTNINNIDTIKIQNLAFSRPGEDSVGNKNMVVAPIIPDTVTIIGGRAFGGCTSLTKIIIPDSVTTIEDNVFVGCTSLTSVGVVGSGALVEISDSVTKINGSTFRGCTSLKNVELPANVTSIGYNAFSDCISLERIVIPEGVVSFGIQVFGNCTSLNTIIFNGTIEQWNSISKKEEGIDRWNYNVPATYVQCSDGEVSLL